MCCISAELHNASRVFHCERIGAHLWPAWCHAWVPSKRLLLQNRLAACKCPLNHKVKWLITTSSYSTFHINILWIHPITRTTRQIIPHLKCTASVAILLLQPWILRLAGYETSELWTECSVQRGGQILVYILSVMFCINKDNNSTIRTKTALSVIFEGRLTTSADRFIY